MTELMNKKKNQEEQEAHYITQISILEQDIGHLDGGIADNQSKISQLRKDINSQKLECSQIDKQSK